MSYLDAWYCFLGDRGLIKLGLCISSRIEGATYVKPSNGLTDIGIADSHGESTGVILVNFVSNKLASSSLVIFGLNGGSNLRFEV